MLAPAIIALSCTPLRPSRGSKHFCSKNFGIVLNFRTFVASTQFSFVFLFNFLVMAKAYITQSKRIGSVGGETYSVVKGQTIVRAKPVSVSNPRTDAQMTQRTQFLSAVRFYQRATQRFFKFAFEGKKSVESDYNAFMRLNANLGGYLTKAQSDAVGFPMIAPFTVTQGSLPNPTYGLDIALHGDESLAQMFIGNASEGASAPTTIGQVSELILATYPNYRAGDIVTICALYSTVDGEFWNDLDATAFKTSTDEVIWSIYQIILDTTNDTALADAGLQSTIEGGKIYLERVIAPLNSVCGCIVVVSRNEPSGLKVSNSQVALSPAAMSAYEAMRSDAHRQQVLAWWGAQQQAILQGSVAQPVAPASKPRVISVEGSYDLPIDIEVNKGGGFTASIGFNVPPTDVTTADFSVVGFQSSKWTLDFMPSSSAISIEAADDAQGSAQLYYGRQMIGTLIAK